MSRTVAIANRKGGVGKTTTALCLAEGLSARGYKVLLVDLDQQHNATAQYRALIEDTATVYDLLTDSKLPCADCIQTTKRGDIIAGDDYMNTAEEKLAALDSREFLLFAALDEVKESYDYIIIDCPPTLGLVMKNILVAADEVIVPVICDAFSDTSFEAFMRQVQAVKSNRRLNPQLTVLGILITQYERGRRLSAEYDERMPRLAKEYGTRMFDTRIRRCEKARQAQATGVSLYELAPSSTAAFDYREFIDEFLNTETNLAQ